MPCADFPEGKCTARSCTLYCFLMTGRRFGVGVYFLSGEGRVPTFLPLTLEAPVACALFPGMVAAGRIYADLVVSEIER